MVDTQRTGCRIIPQCVGSVFFQYRHGVDDVSDRGVHGSSVRRHDESVNHNVIPGFLAGHLFGTQYGVERPGPYNIMGLRSHGHGVQLLVKFLISFPVCIIKSGARRIHPGIENIGGTDQITAAFGTFFDRGFIFGRIAVEHPLGGANGMIAIFAFPDGDGGCKHSLTAENPIPFQRFHPIHQTDFHKFGMPIDFIGFLQNFFFEVQRLKEPLRNLKIFYGRLASPANRELLRVILLFFQKSQISQVIYGCGSGFSNSESLVFTRYFGHSAGFVNTFLHREMVFHNPFQIVFVSDGTYHDKSGTVFRIYLFIGNDLYFFVEHGRNKFFAHQMGLFLVIGMNGNHLTGAQELGPCGGNQYGFIRIRNAEFDKVEFGDIIGVVHFRVCKCGHTSGTPINGIVGFVDQASVEEFDKGQLSDFSVIWSVGLIVDAGIHAFPEFFEIPGHFINEAVGIFAAEFSIFASGQIQFRYVVLFLHFDFDGSTVYVKT